jgi:hypothetical protein
VFDNLLAPLRAKLRLAATSAACYAIAGIAGLVAFAFALAALFSYLAGLYGTITAALIIAGGFVVVAIIPLIILAVAQRKEERRLMRAAAKARTTQWISPATLSLGLQAVRMVGKNKGIAAAAIGSLLVGWLMSQMLSGEEEKDEEAAEPAE